MYFLKESKARSDGHEQKGLNGSFVLLRAGQGIIGAAVRQEIALRKFLNMVASRSMIFCVKVSWEKFVALVSIQSDRISGRNCGQKLSGWTNALI